MLRSLRSLTACTALALAGCAGSADLADGPTPTLYEAPDLVRSYADTITPEELAGHLYVFASDHFEGRETTARGQKLAAAYIAGQQQTMGLRPAGRLAAESPYALEAYYQPVPLSEGKVQGVDVEINRGGLLFRTAQYNDTRSDVYPLSGGPAGEDGGPNRVEAPVVFFGYGLRGQDMGDGSAPYDDVQAAVEAGVEVADRWVMVLAGEPVDGTGKSLLAPDGTTLPPTATGFYGKLRSVFTRGVPAGILIVDGPTPEDDRTVAEKAALARREVGRLSLASAEGGGRRQNLPPVLVISEEMADAILAPSEQSVSAVRSTIRDTRTPVVFGVEGTEVAATIRQGARPAMTENVLAVVPGSDLADEVVVISAHYDHIGVDPFERGDGINNGADDDGSGSMALLELAEAFQMAAADGHGPRRTLLFLHVSGEEKGLLGSEHYADNDPVFPLDQTVANLNVDMIGRRDPTFEGDPSNYVYVIGAELISDEIDQINTDANDLAATGLTLSKRFNSPDDPNQFFRRSDHWNFGKHGIPFIFYFTGTHEDYHQPGDEPQKIDYDQLARRTQLIFATAWELANRDERPAVSGDGFGGE
jgi:hypothetical protein